MVVLVEIVAALRVKNEARWIKDVLDSVKWCNATYLMDDHSTDRTREIAKRSGAVVMESPFADFDEARDKEWLCARIAEKHKVGTWVLLIDGDEVLEPGGEAAIWKLLANNTNSLAWSLRILYLWDSPDQIRVDGIYGRFRRPSLFRMIGNYNFKRTGPKGNLHCSSVPAVHMASVKKCDIALLHYGYMNKADRIRKWKYYNGLDPHNRMEGYDAAHPERGSYCHVVQGDIPEVPASAILMHAGPLELRPL